MTCHSPSGKCDQTTCVVAGRCEWPERTSDDAQVGELTGRPVHAWAGKFGDEYTKRNRVDWRARYPFWQRLIGQLGARSILEVGCNAGWNLTAIKEAAPWAKAVGIDVNRDAVRLAQAAGVNAWHEPHGIFGFPENGIYELVFTAGVLIHIPQPELEQTMQDIIRASARWVLAIEYHADESEHIMYRDQRDLLWKRPFGAMYEAMGLKPVGLTYVLGPDQGFDNCTVYLLEKPC